MKQSLKQQIATGVSEYAKANNLSNNDVSKATGVNAGYISNIFRNQFVTEVNGKAVPIGDLHFYKLAAFAGISLKKEYWTIVESIQYKEILAILMDTMKNQRTYLIINDTGLGKTKCVDIFCNKVPQHTYRITVGSSYRLEDIISELCEKIGIDVPERSGRMKSYSLKKLLEKIASKLMDLKAAGHNPKIILDEAENLPVQVLQTIKELYDYVYEHCSIVLIGTDQILDKMLNKRNKNRTSVPQLYRRFKAGIRYITPLKKERDFKEIFSIYEIDEELQKLICHHCDNYGELHDHLEPVIRYADEHNRPVNKELFCLINPQCR